MNENIYLYATKIIVRLKKTKNQGKFESYAFSLRKVKRYVDNKTQKFIRFNSQNNIFRQLQPWLHLLIQIIQQAHTDK